ncbi:MAG: TrkH family potassium uptake protein, partial [Deltaproteobacteria bacterium]
MNIRLTLRLLGALLIFLGGTLLVPVPFSLWFRDGALGALILSALLAAITGCALFFGFRADNDLSLREGFAVVTLAWVLFTLFGALPFLFSGAIPSPVDAIFETMSGFTTTGATILTEIEGLPQSILLW